MSRFPIELMPPAASTSAARVDPLFAALSVMWLVLCTALAALILFFAIHYRKGNRVDRTNPLTQSPLLEAAWIAGPLLVFLGLFLWSARVYLFEQQAPSSAMEIYVVGKQWMWKVQHPQGRREINELHVPVGRAVKMIMTSEDVLHDLFFPAFRVKADAVPGRYTHLWFEASKAGTYPIYCAEYCGTKHSGMIGEVIVMEPDDYQAWLTSGTQEGSLSSAGAKLFQDLACNTCHRSDAQGRGPVLAGLYGKRVALQTGETVQVDEAYLREAILMPSAKITAGFQPTMPTFQGLVSEEGLVELIEYVKSMQPGNVNEPVRSTPGGPAPNENTPAQAPQPRN